MTRTLCLRTATSGALASLAAALLLTAAGPAAAIPAFARKYGVACSTCHEVWPRLNDFGQRFRDNGYRMKNGRDLPVDQDPAYWPITFRTTVGYSFLRQTLVPVDKGSTPAADGSTAANGTITTNSGQFGFSGLDIHSIGTLGEKISFMVTVTPFLASAGFGRGASPGDGDLETAFVGVHEILGTTWLNLRVGKMAPDLPEDEHRQIQLTQGYNSYHFHLPGSVETFEPGENQTGLELYGHDANSRNRVSVSLFNANGFPFGSNSGFNSPTMWGHATHTQYLDNDWLPSIRVGLFGALGWQPTQFETCTPGAGAAPCQPQGMSGGPPAPVAFSGYDHKTFHRLGGEVHLYFLNTYFPLHVQGALFHAGIDKDLIQDPSGAPATDNGSWLGGWVELAYTPEIHWNFTLRYEQIGITNSGFDLGLFPGLSPDAGNAAYTTASLRHTFEITSRTEVALHLEASDQKTWAPDGTTPHLFQVLAALDMAY